MIPWNKGKKHSAETREKMKKNHKGALGKHWQLSEKTKEKMRIANLGEKNPAWRGGTSYEPYSVDWTQTLKRSIRERDKYICRNCNQYGNNVHHIDYDRKNCNPVNLITLCNSCHQKTNHNREYWNNLFVRSQIGL